MTKDKAYYFTLLFLIGTFFSFVSTANAANPTITSIAPFQTIPGENFEIYGTDLTDKVRFTFSDGKTLNIMGTLDATSKTVGVEVPLDIAPGIYKISVIGPSGPVTANQNLTVRTGGSSFSQSNNPSVPTKGLPTDLGSLIEQIFTWSLGILGISVFVMFFYGGFLYLTAAGNTSKAGEARSRMMNAVFGAILLVSSYIVLNTINPDFVKTTLNLPGIGNSGQSSTGTALCSNPLTPPAGSPPNMLAVIQQVASEFPQYLSQSCQDEGGNWNFMDEVVKRLHAADPKWGYNGKRGSTSDLSKDAISYYFGTGSPSQGSKEVYIIDIIGGHCGPNPQPGWIDQTPSTFRGCTTGAYVYPR